LQQGADAAARIPPAGLAEPKHRACGIPTILRMNGEVLGADAARRKAFAALQPRCTGLLQLRTQPKASALQRSRFLPQQQMVEDPGDCQSWMWHLHHKQTAPVATWPACR